MNKKKTISLLVALLLFAGAPSYVIHAEESSDQPTAEAVPQNDGSSSETTKSSSPVLTGYTISKVKAVKDDVVTIKVSVKDTSMTLAKAGGKDNLDITKLVDSFTEGSIWVDITSDEDSMLTYDVTFSNVKYSGSGNTLKFMTGFKNDSDSFSTLELTISEAEETEKKTETASNETTNTQSTTTEVTKPDAAVPNVIVGNYSYGDNEVLAGGKFPLTFTLKNTGRLAVENMVVTVDGGESFTIDGSSNTFYFNRIGSNGTKDVSINLQALATTKSGAQTIGINCKYEYLDSNKRSSATSEIKISVPVSQQDRFQVNAPTIPEKVTVGEEVTLSLPYVNKGKSEVSNVEATIDGDVETVSKTQNLGNFESGKSGNIGFVFTPKKVGETKVTLKISYEDANLETKTIEYPITLKVEKAEQDETDSIESEEDESNN